MPFVTLQFPEGVLDENPEEMSWLQCARKQTTEDIDLAVLEALEDGDCLALFDRNCFTEEWSANSRKIFACIHKDHAYIFDEQGQPIDDAANFTPQGAHLLVANGDGGSEGFLKELGDGSGAEGTYYMLPTLDLLPTLDDDDENEDENEDDSKTNKEFERLLKIGQRVKCSPVTRTIWTTQLHGWWFASMWL
jgi:hypothetical protein